MEPESTVFRKTNAAAGRHDIIDGAVGVQKESDGATDRRQLNN